MKFLSSINPLIKALRLIWGEPALLPEDYVPDVHTRLVLYKRIASAKTIDDLDDIEAELIDRFGLLPEYAKNLFQVTQLKLTALSYGVTRIEMGHEAARLRFAKQPNIDVNKLLSLIQDYPDMYKLDGAEKLTIYAETNTIAERIDTIVNLLNDLQLKRAA